MGDVPGICELPLTRAIVQYRDVHEMDTPGGRIEDIGLALDLGAELGSPLALGSTARAYFALARSWGRENQDCTAMLLLLEDIARARSADTPKDKA